MAQNITPNYLVPGSGYIEKLKAGTNVTLTPASGQGAEVEVASAGAAGPPGPPGAGGAIAYHIDAYTASNQLNNSGPSLPNAVEWLTTVVNNGITIVNNDEINFAYTGTYMIEVTLNIANNVTVDPVQVWLLKNGANVAYTNHEVKVDTYSDPFTFSWLVTVTNPNDRFQIVWWSTDLTTKLQTVFITGPPSRPNVPSSTLNVWQVIYQGVSLAAPQTLADTLAIGNSAGGLDINMNGNDIQGTSTHYTSYIQPNVSISPSIAIQNATAINLTATQVGLNTTGNTFISGSGAGSRLAVSMGGNQRLEVNSDGVAITPSFSGGGGNLSVTGIGGGNPLFIMQNNSGTNQTVKMDMVMSRNTPALPTPGDVIATITTKGDNYAGNLVEYTQIESIIQNIGNATGPPPLPSINNLDGTMNFKCITNGAYNTYISLNGSSQQINMGKDVLMGTNNIQNVGYIGLTAGSGGVGAIGQSLVSRGGSACRWNYNMCGASIVGTGGSSVLNAGAFTDIVGGLAINLSSDGFVLSPVNKYKVSINGTFDGVADAVRMYMEIQASGTGPVSGGGTFNSVNSLYYYTEHVSGFGTAYTTFSFSDIFTCTLIQGGTATVNLWVEPSSGSHTIGNNRHQITIEPLYA